MTAAYSRACGNPQPPSCRPSGKGWKCRGYRASLPVDGNAAVDGSADSRPGRWGYRPRPAVGVAQPQHLREPGARGGSSVGPRDAVAVLGHHLPCQGFETLRRPGGGAVPGDLIVVQHDSPFRSGPGMGHVHDCSYRLISNCVRALHDSGVSPYPWVQLRCAHSSSSTVAECSRA